MCVPSFNAISNDATDFLLTTTSVHVQTMKCSAQYKLTPINQCLYEGRDVLEPILR